MDDSPSTSSSPIIICGLMLNNHMRTFKQFVEDKDYMARSINVQGDEKMAKDIIWMAVGQGKGSQEISQYINSSAPPDELSQAGGYTPRSVNRTLSSYGLSGDIRKQMKVVAAQTRANQADNYKKSRSPEVLTRQAPKRSVAAGTRRTQDQIRSTHHANRADLAAQAQQPQMPPNQRTPKLASQSAFDLTNIKRQGRAAS